MASFISAISTASPPYRADQGQIADFMIDFLNLNEEEARKLKVLYRATGIQRRYSILEDFSRPLNGSAFFSTGKTDPTVNDRMKLFQDKALELAVSAVDGLKDILDLKEITHLITVSCTGMYAPGIDIDLIQRLGLNSNIERTSINFMGCYAAFNGIKMANHVVKADPEARILLVCLETCSIHLQSKTDEDSLLSNALFGDGAAAVLITSGGVSDRELELTGFYSDLALSGKQEMGWFIGDLGFEMKLTTKVPDVIQEGIAAMTGRLLEQINMSADHIDHYAIHPGGKRILEVVEHELGIERKNNKAAHEVLREFGNMSSPTILFVLQKILKDLSTENTGEHVLSFAFGPGLTLESMVLKTHIHA